MDIEDAAEKIGQMLEQIDKLLRQSSGRLDKPKLKKTRLTLQDLLANIEATARCSPKKDRYIANLNRFIQQEMDKLTPPKLGNKYVE